MNGFFISVYRYFSSHKMVFYAILILTTLVFAFFALKISFEENIMTLLPKTEKSSDCAVAFGDIKVKDKVFVEILDKEGGSSTSELAGALDSFLGILAANDRDTLIANAFYHLDVNDLMNIVYYGMDALPCHLGEWFYPMLEDYVETGQTPPVPDFGPYAFADGHIFSPDSTLALAFLSPSFSIYDTISGSELEKLLSGSVDEFEKDNPGYEVLYHGAVIEGTYNSRKIKKDMLVTLSISLILVCVFIGLCFKSKRTLPLLLAPIAYGTLFSLACIYLIKGSVSLMAMGIGAAVLGVALSYCLHVLTHQKFTKDIEMVISEQAKPVCLGSITTVGAFAGLFLTSSELLRDFGLFASLSLLGTTAFVLLFLPQFLSAKSAVKNEKAFKIINRVNSIAPDRNKAVVIFVSLAAVVCLSMSGRVKFDNDLNHIGYKEFKMVRSENVYNEHVNDNHRNIYYAANAAVLDDAIAATQPLYAALDSLKQEGMIYGYSGAEGILVTESEQSENANRWHGYWNEGNTEKVFGFLRSEADKYGWDALGFDIPGTFKLMAQSEFEPQSIYDAGVIPEGMLCNYVENNEDGWLVFTSVLMDAENFVPVTDILTKLDGVIVMDPFYYTGDMVEIAHRDFTRVYIFSSIFVFIVLLISFRSFVVTVIAFLPILLSWYILQGIMAITGLEFNLVNILISTFVFGVGVDYSIFVMDGLISRYRFESHRLLVWHKAAIFFSALTLIVMTGSLAFAAHPAIKSIGIVTIIGMTSSILITYVIEPLFFRMAMKNDFIRKRVLHE